MQPAKTSSTILPRFLESEASGGIILMVSAALALLAANSPWASHYFGMLHTPLAGHEVLHWINDALMALFFLLVGLEIKREWLEGKLARWQSRVLPGIAALGGVIVPAVIYAAINLSSPQTLRGWAIPTATDIAFALGVLSLLGSRVPSSLKIFLAALAIIDDLIAVLIIAFFYTTDIQKEYLGAALVMFGLLMIMHHHRVTSLSLYLAIGAVLWYLVWRSGVHATIAGVLLALAIPVQAKNGQTPPLHRLESWLAPWVGYLIVPVFGFANAGVDLSGVGLASLENPVTLGIMLGLFVGKQIGVFGATYAAIKSGIAEMPAGANAKQIYGIALLCGIGFTMSLFVGLLSFRTPELQDACKIGVLLGSGLSALVGIFFLRRVTVPPSR